MMCRTIRSSQLSVLHPGATEPNALIYLAYLGAVVLVAAMITLGVGLVRARAIEPTATPELRARA